ncbi:MAG: cell division ATP-binding protein FtsE [SAR324 cluster bacterium]
MIELDNVTKSYQRKLPVLDHARAVIGKGEFAYLTGVSGAGKTTVFRLLMRMEQPDAGEVRVAGENVRNLKPEARARLRRKIGMVFQDYKLLPHDTVADNVALPLRIAGIAASRHKALVEERLKQVGLGGRGNEPVVALSGGEKQLVSIARALTLAPALLLADEPTGNLDQAMAFRVMELLREIHASGCTVVVATHDVPLIRAFRARTLLIRERQIHEVRLVENPSA